MKRILSIILAFVLVFSFVPTAHASFTYENQVKVLMVGNPQEGDIYYSKNMKEKLPVASISKLMTYLVTMDLVGEGKVNLNDEVEISKKAASFNKPGNSRFELNEGDKIKLKDLLVGLMVVSGNDAAWAIAEHVAGDVESFVNMMNDTAKDLKLENSSFVNPSGLTEKQEGQEGEEVLAYNEMTGEDLFNLVVHILEKYPEVEEYGKMKKISYPERNYTDRSSLPLQDYSPMIGLKTGYTQAAGYGFVGLFDMSLVEERRDYKLMTIVLGAETQEIRVTSTKELLEYVDNNYAYREYFNPSRVLIDYYDDAWVERFIPLYPEKSFSKIIASSSTVDIKYNLFTKEKAPYESGKVLGEAILYEDGEEIARVNLKTNKHYPKATFLESLGRALKEFFDNILSLF